MASAISRFTVNTIEQINLASGWLNSWLPALFLRLILAYEFGEAGLEKWHGENWFDQLMFPFPFNLLSAEMNWNLAMTTELLGAALLILGFATRFVSFNLIVVTVIAILTVHWPMQWHNFAELWMGYRITDTGFGNYKLPLLYILMFLPLLLGGAGKCSVDELIVRALKRR